MARGMAIVGGTGGIGCAFVAEQKAAGGAPEILSDRSASFPVRIEAT